MTERQIKMNMSQEFMRTAVDYYLRNVVFKTDLEIKDVKVDGGSHPSGRPDHFLVDIEFPEAEGKKHG